MTHSLTYERTLAAAPETVFEAWTDPKVMAEWFGPEAVRTEIETFDLTVGGAYRLVMRGEGDFWLSGRFVAIEPSRRLALTWKWDHGEDETTVEVSFRPNGAGTHMTVVHTGFGTEEDQTRHDEGWTSTWRALDTCLTARAA